MVASLLVFHRGSHIASAPVFPARHGDHRRHGQLISSALAARGHKVSAVVTQPCHDSLAPAASREFYRGIPVRRVPVGPLRGRKTRTVRFLGYVPILLVRWALESRQSPDLVLCFHIPRFLPGLALLVARLRGARLVCVIQDIRPNILIESHWLTLPRPARNVWDWFNRVAFSTSDVLVVLGEGMRRTLIEKGAPPDRVVVIPLWAEPPFPMLDGDPEWRREHDVDDGDLVVLYAGDMRLMHPLQDLLETARHVHGRGVRIVIAGDGVNREHWQREVRRLGVEHVLMLPFQRSDAYRRLVAASDVSVVALSDGMERLAVPSRPYSVLVAGRPVVALTSPDADIAVAVRQSGAGWHVRGAEDLTHLLLNLADRREQVTTAAAARALYERDHSRERAMSRYCDLVEPILAAAS
jgi:glycosyltransferase involved in cell wall biosynthesis